MNICVVGAGYVGLTTSAVLSKLGHTVWCCDRDDSKITSLQNGHIPIFEPGLEELVQQGVSDNRLHFSSDVPHYVEECPVIMVAVGTPSAPDGTADLVYVKSVLLSIANGIRGPKTVIIKSTVPPGTGDWAQDFFLRRGVSKDWIEVVSNPEFLREGTAIHDSFHPDRILVGASSPYAGALVASLYDGISAPVLHTGRTEAEMIKYGSNSFLAVKLSFINELARLCETFHADITEVSRGIGMDVRIGEKFLQAGIGYGGSCLPKDVSALIATASGKGMGLKLLEAAASVNETQVQAYVSKLERVLGALNQDVSIAVWGATFKENTDDLRYSKALVFMEALAAKGCGVNAFDPLSAPDMEGVKWASSQMEALEGADALVVATGWKQFVSADWQAVKAAMKGTVVVDGRNVLDRAAVEEAGLHYVGLGRPGTKQAEAAATD
ncbi:UDP-glucose dehydrogenase family protein [Paenibacillus sp. CAU 1782]